VSDSLKVVVVVVVVLVVAGEERLRVRGREAKQGFPL